MVFFFSCSYWAKLRLIKVQQTLPQVTVVVVVVVVIVAVVVVVAVFYNVVVMALLVVTDPIVNICGQ